MEIESKKGEKILVSIEDYDHLNQFRWNINRGYALGCVNKNNWRIHRYIMIELCGNKELTRHNFIDHINGNKLDNRRKNLRIVTAAENNRNKIKKNDASSKYLGVSKKRTYYIAQIILNDENKTILRSSYKIEEHAAYQYNVWIDQYNIIHAKKNNIEKPENFIEYKKKESGKIVSTGIRVTKSGNYSVKYAKHLATFKYLEEAKKYLENYKNEIKIKKEENLINESIKRNTKGECIIELFNRKKEKVGETIVDEECYYNLIQYKWCLQQQGYVIGKVKDKLLLLHRYILNYDGKDYIDHINNNPLDNRKNNLRIVTPSQNNMNKISNKNSTSKYIGVSWSNKENKWQSNIKVDGKQMNLGRFKCEIEAAKARDIATKKFYGEFGNLNFSDEIK